MFVWAYEMKNWLDQNFQGWHHTTANGLNIQKTALAVVPKKNLSGTSIALGRATEQAHNIKAGQLSDFARYIKILFNRGLSLQNRADNIVLTRNVFVLVKGGSGTHAATRCKVDGYVCTTEAHTVVQAQVMSDMMKEIQSNLHDVDVRPHSMIWLVRKGLANTNFFRSFKDLADKLNSLNYSFKSDTAANLMLAAAVLHTGFADAGARFRDRTSRNEAARHYGESMLALINTPLSVKK